MLLPVYTLFNQFELNRYLSLYTMNIECDYQTHSAKSRFKNDIKLIIEGLICVSCSVFDRYKNNNTNQECRFVFSFSRGVHEQNKKNMPFLLIRESYM